MSTDPTALAREVLDAAHEDETITVCTIPDNKVAALARAVLRMDALAGELDREGMEAAGLIGFPPSVTRYCKMAARIRTALNGDSA